MDTKTKELGLKVGTHQFRKFEGLDAAFGARGQDYPTRADIPDQFYNHNSPYNQVVSSLFFSGGKLEDFGLSFKPGIDKAQAMTAIRALLSSFDPKHEIKMGTVAWALSKWCDGTPKAR